jgi:hypothetical protein
MPVAKRHLELVRRIPMRPLLLSGLTVYLAARSANGDLRSATGDTSFVSFTR